MCCRVVVTPTQGNGNKKEMSADIKMETGPLRGGTGTQGIGTLLLYPNAVLGVLGCCQETDRITESAPTLRNRLWETAHDSSDL